MSSSGRAVITGLGIVSCLGDGKEMLWDAILKNRMAITHWNQAEKLGLKAKCVGQISNFNIAKYLPYHRYKRLDRCTQFAVASAFLALQDAGIHYASDNPQPRYGVCFGTALGGIANAENEHGLFQQHQNIKEISPHLALQIFGGATHSNIAIECGFRGVGTTNANSCAAGTVAIGEALRYIRDGWADVIVAGGAEAPIAPLTYSAFAKIKTMSCYDGPPEKACRPFDFQRDGFVMGEGGASLVIEEYEHARQRGAFIYAEVIGYGLTNDAYHMTSPCPDGEAVVHAMRQALNDANIAPDEVDYINAHASSTKINDANETACIKTVFGEAARRIPVSGTKCFTAHPLGATGAMEAVICAMAIRENFLPPTLNYETPDLLCDLDIVPNLGRKKEIHTVLSNSFGFGGINACLVLRKI